MTSLWQITNGKKFAQLIFSGENLIDCEFLKGEGEIMKAFVDKFHKDSILLLHRNHNKFSRHHNYYESLNIEENSQDLSQNSTIINDLKRLQQIPKHFLELINLKNLQKKCNDLHKNIRQHLYFEEPEHDMNNDFALANQR